MVGSPGEEGESAEEAESRERRRLIRKAGLYAAGLFAAAVGVAVGGGALLAVLFGPRLGLGFGRAWAYATALLIGIPLVAHGITVLGERWRGASGG